MVTMLFIALQFVDDAVSSLSPSVQEINRTASNSKLAFRKSIQLQPTKLGLALHLLLKMRPVMSILIILLLMKSEIFV